ncbi:MAG: TonB-dependent receptor, partial [Desulfobulbaceae bacterium]|nr:TonB-dependent receptor [Desulfobulbaceae bacterium]
SRMLLDGDLAVKTAARATMYHRLGFTDQALAEGYRAADLDPDGFMAHRFLSGSHATSPRHEIARVSELLQAQLLQPVNVAPIRPSAGESELFQLHSGLAMDPAHNEFTSLFSRDRLSLLLDAMMGERETTNGESVLSMVRGNFSLSAGYLQFSTDGFRQNNDQEEEIADIFGQWALSPATSLQAEYRYRDGTRGDLSMLFNEWDFNEHERRDEQKQTYRLGLLHRQSAASTFLFNLQHQELESELSSPSEMFSLNSQTDANGTGAEFQHIQLKSVYDLISGIGLFHIDGSDTDRVAIVDWPLEPFTYPRDAEHLNLYLYGNFRLAETATLTTGASYDNYDNELAGSTDGNQLNPKLGISWSPFACTTVRGAIFRTWKRTLLTDQTLEKTHIVGFNQFYDDVDATDAWLHGVAVEQRFSSDLNLGLEFFERDLSVPYQDPYRMETARGDWEEETGRFHIDWTPNPHLALTFHHGREDHRHATACAYNVKELTTEITGGRATFILSPYHLSLYLAADYYAQEGDFEISPGIFEPGSDTFPLVDIGLYWPLPKNKGMLSMGIKNVLNEEFQYFEIDDRNLSIQPATSGYIRCSLLL